MAQKEFFVKKWSVGYQIKGLTPYGDLLWEDKVEGIAKRFQEHQLGPGETGKIYLSLFTPEEKKELAEGLKVKKKYTIA